MLANVLAQFSVLRIDLTQDKRHTISTATKQLVESVNQQLEVEVYLSGNFNSGFTRLSDATRQLLSELAVYGDIYYTFSNPLKFSDSKQDSLNILLAQHNFHPTVIYENNGNGTQQQTMVYPFARLSYKGCSQWISLLENRRDRNGAENLNSSVEALEYKFSLAISSLIKQERDKVLMLEGHGELLEQNIWDVQTALAEYFDIYRGEIDTEADCLDQFACVIVADPQLPFSEQDKFVIDQYLMNGGRILWLVSGVRFSEQVLEDEGFTPLLALDVNLTDMLFRYGVRINNRMLQDMQCLSVPVNVSPYEDQPQWQPMPWCYAPLLLTSVQSPITSNMSPVLAMFCSDLSAVGEDESVEKTVLLASSEMAGIVPVPSEINLADLTIAQERFVFSYLPVAMSLEGVFQSLFAHRLPPEGIGIKREKLKSSVPTKQIVVAAGQVASNDLQQGKPLPAGYDRYSRTQFANRDFVVNSVLWLTDYSQVLFLRKKTLPLRLLNKAVVQNSTITILLIALFAPMILLAVSGAVVFIIRRKKYIKH